MTSDAFSLRGFNVLLTGSTGHLGRAIASALAEAGATVVLNASSAAAVNELADEMTARGMRTEAASFDITDHHAIRAFFEKWGERPLHGLVNNAYRGALGNLESASAEEYRASYEVSVIASQVLLNAALPALRRAVVKNGSSAVVNVASMYASVSPDQRVYPSREEINPPFYGAAKAALSQWSRYAACELGREGIRVNAVSPGPFPSPVVQKQYPEFVKALSNKVPLGRIGQPAEVAGAIVFLLSPAASFINGADLAIDGGWTAW